MARKKGSVSAVIGAQWGDEGKGKIVHYASSYADIVVRFAGGGNAGHTARDDRGEFKSRITPVGVLSPRTQTNIIGRGTVPQLGVIVEEFKAFSERGIDVTNVVLDRGANLVMPWHVFEDVLDEEMRGEENLGTTKSGIGPAYSDKYLRVGLRAGDLLDFPKFRELFWKTWDQKVKRMGPYYSRHLSACDRCEYCIPIKGLIRRLHTTLDEIEDQLQYIAKLFGDLDSFIKDTPPILLNAIDEGQSILLEGAQG